MVVFHLLTKLPKAHQKTIQKLNRATIVLGLLLPDSIRRLQSSLIAGSLEPGQPTNAAILVRLTLSLTHSLSLSLTHNRIAGKDRKSVV